MVSLICLFVCSANNIGRDGWFYVIMYSSCLMFCIILNVCTLVHSTKN